MSRTCLVGISLLFSASVLGSAIEQDATTTIIPNVPNAPVYTASSLPPQVDLYEEERKYYRQTLSAIRKGHKTNSKLGLKKLKSYPLYGYLKKEQLVQRLRQLPYKDVNQYLEKYGDTVAGMQLRKKWLKVLAKKKLWKQYTRYYSPKIRTSSLRCSHLEALHRTGNKTLALNKTSELWLNGSSMPDECNSVFKRWQQAGKKTDELVWKRVNLALNENNTMLARYLSDRASARLKPYTRRLISVHRKPHRIANKKQFKDGKGYTTDIIYQGLIKLASRNYKKAHKLWEDYRGYIQFSPAQYSTIRNKIARQVIASDSPNSLEWLVVNDPNAEDSYLLEWRIRLALKQKQWAQAGRWIALLPDDLQSEPRWRYWKAKTYQKTDQNLAESNEIMKKLAQERHYYGFLAADAGGHEYGFNHSEQMISDADFQIKRVPSLERSFEFYKLGELTSARREWREGIRPFNKTQLASATALAHSWGWHQQAIHTTIKAEQWNNLSIRFPLAYQSHMTVAAKSSTIQLEWLYAIARQESAFADDAYSSIGARGLLQLRPSTGKAMAKKIGVKFRARDLYKADKNIKLGSTYLQQLLTRFNGNRILATAAYNAGPHRVQKWLNRQDEALPHDVWIETLPFYETRSYVQNVLAFSVIYGYRLGIETPLINNKETVIKI